MNGKADKLHEDQVREWLEKFREGIRNGTCPVMPERYITHISCSVCGGTGKYYIPSPPAYPRHADCPQCVTIREDNKQYAAQKEAYDLAVVEYRTKYNRWWRRWGRRCQDLLRNHKYESRRGFVSRPWSERLKEFFTDDYSV